MVTLNSLSFPLLPKHWSNQTYVRRAGYGCASGTEARRGTVYDTDLPVPVPATPAAVSGRGFIGPWVASRATVS